MISVEDDTYQAIALKLLASIGVGSYFNGTVGHDTEQYNSILRATLIIYREPLLDPADPTCSATRIKDIVPVWWEYHLYDEDGAQPTDFCWQSLRGFLL